MNVLLDGVFVAAGLRRERTSLLFLALLLPLPTLPVKSLKDVWQLLSPFFEAPCVQREDGRGSKAGATAKESAVKECVRLP